MRLYFQVAVAIGFEVILVAIGLQRVLPPQTLHIHVKEVELVKGWTDACMSSVESPASIVR